MANNLGNQIVKCLSYDIDTLDVYNMSARHVTVGVEIVSKVF